MARDYVAEAVVRQEQVVALLTAYLDDLNRVDGTSALHDRLVLARECALQALHSIEELTRAPEPEVPAA